MTHFKRENEAQEIEARMAAEVAAAKQIESPDQVTPLYRDSLINLLYMQADSELAGALGYVPCVKMSPTVEEFLASSMIVKDEFRHARVVYKLLENLGEDVDAHVRAHDFTMRLSDSDADIGSQRAADDKRVNIFYYPIDSWVDFCMFNFCMDRGAGHQLEDSLEASYQPWARVLEGIFMEEKFHIAHGDNWVKRLAQDPATHDAAQAALNKWFIRTMNIFGRPNSPKNKIYRELGLKKRDNHDVRLTFAQEVTDRCNENGLKVPEWVPDWENIPMDAYVVG
ncbi:MAG: phenylacetate-CoA oxygenase subunit PaaI [Chloroflexota bacterium]|nr:phenylacetate-CoA oxygenase subunit PaaI [Chloroflexota bacterium]